MNEVKNAFKAVSHKVLEEWGLMMVEEVPPSREMFSCDEPLLVASMEFRGIVRGRYVIVTQRGFGETLAQNVLGSDVEIDEAIVEDGLKELANVLCGNMLTECYGADVVFELTRPVVDHRAFESLSGEFDERTLAFLADDAPVLFSFALELGDVA